MTLWYSHRQVRSEAIAGSLWWQRLWSSGVGTWFRRQRPRMAFRRADSLCCWEQACRYREGSIFGYLGSRNLKALSMDLSYLQKNGPGKAIQILVPRCLCPGFFEADVAQEAKAVGRGCQDVDKSQLIREVLKKIGCIWLRLNPPCPTQ